MIEGTRQYKGGDKGGEPATKSENALPESSPNSTKAPQPEASSGSDAVNLERREWFNSLIPALGDGLVKILRASNNLQSELHGALKAKAESFTAPEDEESEKKPGR